MICRADIDWIAERRLNSTSAGMSDAPLATTYEIYRMASGSRADGVPRAATMQAFSGRSGRATVSQVADKRQKATVFN